MAATAHGGRQSVIHPDGRFRVDGLMPGDYKFRPSAFDYPTHAYEKPVTVTIPEAGNQQVELNFEVEAKELLYGRAVFANGDPVYPGSYIARFTRNPNNAFGGRSFSLSTKPGGLFRVALTKEERRLLEENFSGKIEISSGGGDILLSSKVSIDIHVDSLSDDRQKPTKVVLPNRKADAPD